MGVSIFFSMCSVVSVFVATGVESNICKPNFWIIFVACPGNLILQMVFETNQSAFIHV